MPKLAVVFLIRFAHILEQGILFVKKNAMKNEILERSLSDEFLTKVQKELRTIKKENFDCFVDCPLRNTQYRGKCVQWLMKVAETRNCNEYFTIFYCKQLFSFALKFLDKQSKQNKI